MRSRLLVALAAMTSIAIPTSSDAGVGGVVQVTETVRVETEVVAPIPGQLVATLRTRRVVSGHGDLASPAALPSGNLQERIASVSFHAHKNHEMICFVNGSSVFFEIDAEDAVTLKVTDASCPMHLSFEPAGGRAPFTSTPSVQGIARENGAESGYARPATARVGTLLGEPSHLLPGTLTRSFRASFLPTATTGTPTPPAPPSVPEAPDPDTDEVPLP